MIKRIIKYFFYFEVMQYEWGRKYFKGKYYLIRPTGLQMGDFWSDEEIKSCQSVTLAVEEHNTPSHKSNHPNDTRTEAKRQSS